MGTTASSHHQPERDAPGWSAGEATGVATVVGRSVAVGTGDVDAADALEEAEDEALGVAEDAGLVAVVGVRTVKVNRPLIG